MPMVEGMEQDGERGETIDLTLEPCKCITWQQGGGATEEAILSDFKTWEFDCSVLMG